MNASEKEEGDILAKELIHEYWSIITSGSQSTWNFYLDPLRYTPHDRWATREQWISVAKQCVERRIYMLFGLEILLAEGFSEYLDTAMEVVADWLKRTGGHDPEYYLNILKYFPPDNPTRLAFLPKGNLDTLWSEGYRALMSVGDEDVCRHSAAQIQKVFSAYPLDDVQVERQALPRMKELGRLCSNYLDSEVMESANRFCLEYLLKDIEIARYQKQLAHEATAGKDGLRSLWIRDDIAYLSWRVGWFDMLTMLRKETWYWQSMFEHWSPGDDNINLLVWSQYAKDELLRRRALHVMRRHEYTKIDGAIAWVRMSHVRWPPE
jgi:hypothetical protein